MGLPAAACTEGCRRCCQQDLVQGAVAAPSIEKQSDGSLVRVQFEPGSNTAEKTAFVPEENQHLFAETRMKYSLAYKWRYEAADTSNFDVWTYSASTGAEVLKEAFERIAARS